MQYQFTIGVGQDAEGEPLADKAVKVEEALQRACRVFGGCSLQHCEGIWRSEGGSVAREPAICLVVNVSSGKERPGQAEEFAAGLRELFRQSCVAVAELPCSFKLV